MEARRQIALAAAVAVVAAFAGLYLGSPWLAAWDLMGAARAGDASRARVPTFDPPAVRASLKGQIDARVERSILRKRAAKGDAVARLGALFGAALVDKAVDATVTPEMIAEAVRTARAPDPASPPSPRPPATKAKATTQTKPKAERVKVGFAMPGLNRFDLRLSRADAPDARLTLILRRRGLFAWKVTDVELPR